MTKDNNRTQFLCAHHIVLILFIIIGGFFLWTEHEAHIMGALPYLILLLCPLMHFFMHRGHGNHTSNQVEHDKHEQGGKR